SAPPPPANDDCSGATVVSGLPFTDTILTGGATTAPDDPMQSCTSGGASQNSQSVWDSVTATPSCTFVLDTFVNSYDTRLTAYRGTCGTLEELACNDDAGDHSQSRTSFSADSGQTVLLEVTGFGDEGGGTLTLNVAVAPPAPANDACSAATVISGIPFADTTH